MEGFITWHYSTSCIGVGEGGAAGAGGYKAVHFSQSLLHSHLLCGALHTVTPSPLKRHITVFQQRHHQVPAFQIISPLHRLPKHKRGARSIPHPFLPLQSPHICEQDSKYSLTKQRNSNDLRVSKKPSCSERALSISSKCSLSAARQWAPLNANWKSNSLLRLRRRRTPEQSLVGKKGEKKKKYRIITGETERNMIGVPIFPKRGRYLTRVLADDKILPAHNDISVFWILERVSAGLFRTRGVDSQAQFAARLSNEMQFQRGN